MVFASNRPFREGESANFDLYYSIFRNGKWSSPVNFGSDSLKFGDINTPYDEYRPVILADRDYTNYVLFFSSNRPGGQGGYDLYFRGVTISIK